MALLSDGANGYPQPGSPGEIDLTRPLMDRAAFAWVATMPTVNLVNGKAVTVGAHTPSTLGDNVLGLVPSSSAGITTDSLPAGNSKGFAFVVSGWLYEVVPGNSGSLILCPDSTIYGAYVHSSGQYYFGTHQTTYVGGVGGQAKTRRNRVHTTFIMGKQSAGRFCGVVDGLYDHGGYHDGNVANIGAVAGAWTFGRNDTAIQFTPTAAAYFPDVSVTELQAVLGDRPAWTLFTDPGDPFFLASAVAPTTFLTFSLSLAIQQAQALTASLSAAVQAPQSTSAVASAAVQAARTAQASLDAAVQATSTAVASLSTAVQASGQQTASINGALQLARSATLALDLAVQAHLSAAASVNLQVQAAASATASVNLQIQAGSSASVSLSMAVLQSALSAVGLDLAVLRVGSQTAGVSAALQAARSAAAAIDIALQIVRSTTAAVDVVLQAARSSGASVNLQIQDGVSVLVGIDVAVQQARNAVAGVQLAISQSAAASASVDAVAMLQRVVSAALGGAVTAARVASAGLSFYVDDGGVIVITGPIRLLAIISQELAFEATIEQA